MTLSIRTLTRCIWVTVKEPKGTADEVVEKTSVINLLLAFVYATKNYLREDYSYDEEELKELISHLPRFSTPSSNLPLHGQNDAFIQEANRNLRRTVKAKPTVNNTKNKTSAANKGVS
jgi:putative membrane protein